MEMRIYIDLHKYTDHRGPMAQTWVGRKGGRKGKEGGRERRERRIRGRERREKRIRGRERKKGERDRRERRKGRISILGRFLRSTHCHSPIGME